MDRDWGFSNADYLLKSFLEQIRRSDTEHETRYLLVIDALYWATQCGYLVGFRIDPEEPEWPVVYIELPTGQVSWHMPQHPVPFDGHSTKEKYRRIQEYVSNG